MVGSEESEQIFEVNGKHYTPPELLAYWIKEREKIRILKKHGFGKPWSEDPIFQTTYFTNVHREDDKVTKWIRENYTVEYFKDDIVMALVAARLFNWPETLGTIKIALGMSDFKVMKEFLLEMQMKKQKIWGGAYLITTHGMKMSKIDYCLDIIEMARTIDWNKQYVACEHFWRKLMQIQGIGSFLAAQVVADLKYTKGHVLFEADDRMYFCAPGPGSLRGLAWFMGRAKESPSVFHEDMELVAQYLRWRDDMQDLQNCLCEFDKYCRVLTGTGRSKRNYNGKS